MLDSLGQERPDFPAAGAETVQARLKTLEFHCSDDGHFALESNGDEIDGLRAGSPRQDVAK